MKHLGADFPVKGVSTRDQNPALQLDALRCAGCGKIFEEKASGAHRERPELKAALKLVRKGDTLVVWKLDRLTAAERRALDPLPAPARRARGAGRRGAGMNIARLFP